MTDRKRVGWELSLCGLLVGLAGLSATALAWQAVSPHSLYWGGIVIDRLSASLSLLVGTVGVVTYRFSMRYLEGEPGREVFLARLAGTVSAAYTLVIANNLLLLLAAWTLTGFGLHALLTYYTDRPEALRPARKKFLISRLGDAALIGAIVLIWMNWRTLDLGVFLSRAVDAGGSDRDVLTWVAVLTAAAALTKSAQFPFHSWLPETMEAPTPVSALMHAGIINAGGALMLRFSPVIVRAPAALLLLTVVGSLTAVLGMLAMWPQVKVKRTLAWSTVGQMGFMMVQCGLAAFPAALVHVLGHGLYKAWSFLRTGDLPKSTPAPAPSSPARTLGLAGLGMILAVPALAAAAAVTGYSPGQSPGELAMAAIVALSIGQLWAVLLNNPAQGWARLGRITVALLGTFGTALAAFSLYRGAELFLGPVIGHLPPPTGSWSWVAAMIPVTALAALTILQAFLPTLSRGPAGRALYVHALNGFYFGAIADRLVTRIWSGFVQPGKAVKSV